MCEEQFYKIKHFSNMPLLLSDKIQLDLYEIIFSSKYVYTCIKMLIIYQF